MSALHLHEHTTLWFNYPEVMFDINANIKRTDMEVIRTRNPQWDIGIELKDGYWITNLERTIVDCLYHRNRADYHGIYAMRQAIATKKSTDIKIMNMARQLGYHKRLRPFFDAFMTEGKY